MRISVILFCLFVNISLAQDSNCGDGTIYANKKQTEYDKRFEEYPKIEDLPKYKGEIKLEELVKQKLKLSDVAKTQIFRLNYKFTVACDGKIKDVKQIGDPRADDWTNIVEIIEGTESSWQPAKEKGKEVDCVFFNSITIIGSQY